MNICLIGKNITNLLLAKNLDNKGINFELFYSKTNDLSKISTRTIGITEDNINFLGKNIKKNSWSIKDIKIYTESNNNEEIINFESKRGSYFSIVKYSNLFQLLEKDLKKSKNIKKFLVTTKKLNTIIKNKKYDLIINSDFKNQISKKYFYRKYSKDYNSTAYTTIINHKECQNKSAYQIFTKFGPLAFLPISEKNTSLVFSIYDKNFDMNSDKVVKLIKFYNKKYNIKNFDKIEKFKLKFSTLRNYYYKNIVSLGDGLHQVHPLAGQGFNMVIRDIKIFSEIIESKLDLGLPLDSLALEEFENKVRHLNFSFSKGIDFVYEFFKIDNKFNNKISNLFLKSLKNSDKFKNFSTKIANRGLFL
tara:strand:+ start:991 stop:2076 length:1086 start_codon:yes stop_codon:yes gene_type:complete